MNQWDDIELFEAVKEGDRDALSELFTRYYDYLKHYALQIAKEPHLVEECIQEMFIYIFKSYGRLGTVRHVKSYLFSAIRRRVLEKLQKERREQSRDLEFIKPSNIQFSDQDLLIQTEHQEVVQQTLLQALNHLPWRQREAIYLRYYNGLKTKEIAEIMGVANQTILNTLYQALEKIRKNEDLKKLFRFIAPWLIFFTQW